VFPGTSDSFPKTIQCPSIGRPLWYGDGQLALRALMPPFKFG
jgi:hypothetical protein